MLLTPTLALLSIIFNFCALLHVSSNWNGLPNRRWHTLDRAIYALEEATTTVYENCLDMITLPSLTSSPIHFSPLRRAEWVYRSSAVRILDLVDGSSRKKTVQYVASLPLLPPSPLKPTDPITSTRILPPTSAPTIYPATFEQFPTYIPSTPSVATSTATRFLGLTGLLCLSCTLVITWLKNRHHRRRLIPAPRPTLTCDVHCQIPVENFHSINTATSIPSYSGTETDLSKLELEGSPSHPKHKHNSCTGLPTTSRTFPVVITNPDGKVHFKADVKLSSNRVTTELSETTSTVSFSIDVVASLDIPRVSEWYVPEKEGDGTPYKAEDSLFLLLVRGLSDRFPPFGQSQDSDPSSKLERDTLSIERTPKIDALALGEDCDVENTSALGEACQVKDTSAPDKFPLDSPMCAVTIPFHHRGFSAFETALLAAGTKMRKDNAHKEGCPHRKSARPKPKDVYFPWLKDVYSCGDTHMDGCQCEEVLAEQAYSEKHPHPKLLSRINDYYAIPESDRDVHSEEEGSGMCNQAPTVSPGLSVRSEMSPASIFDPAEPRPTARSNPSFADGKEPAGLDSTVALMPSFGVVGPEPPFRRRSGGISSPAEFSDGALGEQSMSLEEDDVGTGFISRFTGTALFANNSCSPPSPAATGRVNLLMDALEPILASHTSNLSLEEAALVPPSLAPGRLAYSPLEYSPASARAHSPVNRTHSPEYDDWVGGHGQAVDSINSEPALEDELEDELEEELEQGSRFPFYRPQESVVPSTPPPRFRRY